MLLVCLELPRLMTSEFLKRSGPTKRSPSAATSSHYLGSLKVLDQKQPRKQSLEPDKADHIRAAVYQVKGEIFPK
jgi:microtubule-associated protein 9